VVETYFGYLQAHALAGVGMRTVRWDRAPLGFGSESIRAALAAGVMDPEQRRQLRKLEQRTYSAALAHSGPGLVENVVRKILRQEERRAISGATGTETDAAQAEMAAEVGAEEDVEVQPGENLRAETTLAGEAAPAETSSQPLTATAASEAAEAPRTVLPAEPTASASATSASPEVAAAEESEPPSAESPIPASAREPSPSLEVQEPDPSTAGPADFIPEPAEEGISAEPVHEATAEAASAPAPEQQDPAPSAYVAAEPTLETEEEVASAEPDPSTAGPATFSPENALEAVTAEPAPAESAAAAPDPAPAPAAEAREAEPSTAGTAELSPETAEERTAAEPASASEAEQFAARAEGQAVDATSAEPAVASDASNAEAPSMAGPALVDATSSTPSSELSVAIEPTAEVDITTSAAPVDPSDHQLRAADAVSPVSPEGTATESEIVGHDEPIEGGAATGEVPTEDAGAKGTGPAKRGRKPKPKPS